MSISVVDYVIGSGKITGVFNTPNEDWAPDSKEGEARLLLEGRSILIGTSYVNGGQVIAKQLSTLVTDKTQITANGIDECVITGIPPGTTVEWPDGQTDEVTDGEVRFAVDLPGTYTLTFTAVPYLDQEVTIEAVAAA